MRRKILILLLWGFPLCFCGGEEIPEYSFAPSGNEHFVVEGYESELVGSAERPIPNEPGFWENYFMVQLVGGLMKVQRIGTECYMTQNGRHM